MYMPANPAPTMIASKTVSCSGGRCCSCRLAAMEAFVLMKTQSVSAYIRPKHANRQSRHDMGGLRAGTGVRRFRERFAAWPKLARPAPPHVSERLEVFDDRLALVGRQCSSDDAGAFRVAEFVPPVRVPTQPSLEFKAVDERLCLVPEVYGIVLAVAAI